jgi:ferric-dicitrate binding protein FerR (iron transport regulator)
MRPADFDLLYERYLWGRLAPEEAGALRECLRDPAWRRRWRDLSDLDGAIAGEFVIAAPRRISARRAPRRRAPSRGPAVAAAGVLAVVALGLAVASRPPRSVTVASPPRIEASIPDPAALPSPPPRVDAPPAPPLIEQGPRAEEQDLPRAAERAVSRIPEQRPETPPAVREEPPAATRVLETEIPSVACVQEVSGAAFRRTRSGRIPLAAGDAVRAGEGVELVQGHATMVLADGTRLRAEGPAEIGRMGGSIDLSRGAVWAEVAPQPQGQAFSIRTPHAEARVLGTRFRLAAESGSTRLEVREGKVRLTRTSDGRFVDVGAGHFAVAARGTALAARPLAPQVLFAEDFNRLPANQWPAGWGQHPTEAAARSGFLVLQDRGERFLGCGGSRTATQHAYLPLGAWEPRFVLSFRMRLSGPKNHRAGVELEDGRLDDPALVYDHGAGLFTASRSSAKPIHRVSLRLPEGSWTDWRIAVDGRRFSVAVDGKETAAFEIADLGRLSAVSLNSGGADSAHFDDVKVSRP